MPQTIKLVDAGRKLHLKKMQIAGFKAKASKDGRVLVGFYKDKAGKTKPITRSARELKRKKIVTNSKRFHTVSPLHTQKEFLFFADQFEEHYPFKDYDSIKDENFQHVLGEWLENANIPKTIRSTVRKAIYYRFRESKKGKPKAKTSSTRHLRAIIADSPEDKIIVKQVRKDLKARQKAIAHLKAGLKAQQKAHDVVRKEGIEKAPKFIRESFKTREDFLKYNARLMESTKKKIKKLENQ